MLACDGWRRGSHGLSARRAWRMMSSRPEGPPARSRAPEGPSTWYLSRVQKVEPVKKNLPMWRNLEFLCICHDCTNFWEKNYMLFDCKICSCNLYCFVTKIVVSQFTPHCVEKIVEENDKYQACLVAAGFIWNGRREEKAVWCETLSKVNISWNVFTSGQIVSYFLMKPNCFIFLLLPGKMGKILAT